ncbi:MAG: hypothetical protein P9E24_11140 [Candidatus Competibacter sp.]|nr:hypothetical protein [Candidatus Competibacter sp.]MDG4582639.1 hypothetical protein [Candidatus Competibacter sp.]
MVEQILLGSSSFDGLREIGGFGQPLHTLYPQIRTVLASELEPDAAWLLAEPVVDRANNRIDWYTEGNPEEKPVALSDLPDEQRQPLRARIDDLLGRGRDLAERYAKAEEIRLNQLGAILRVVLAAPAETGVFLVDGRPVLTGWGFAPDRPWSEPAGSSGSAMASSASADPPRDVVVPDIPLPEPVTAAPRSMPPVESTAGSEFPAESPPPAPPGAESSALSPTPREPDSSKPPPLPPMPQIPPPPFAALEAIASSPPVEKPPFEPESTPVATVLDPSPAGEPEPISPLRYVVVGSVGFWSVFVLAVLLALGAVVFSHWRASASDRIAMAPAPSDVEDSNALANALRTETELRARLERVLARLTERRSQCRLPAGADAPAITASAQEQGGVNMGVAPPAAPRSAESPPRDDAGTVPVAGADGRTQLPMAAPDVRTRTAPDRTAPPADREIALTISGRGDVGQEPVAMPATESSVAQADPMRGAPSDTLETAIATAPATPGGARPRKVTPASTGLDSPDSVHPPPVAAAPNPPTGKPPLARTLEEQLSGELNRPPPASVEPPPVKSEPTPEERREFDQRMSAAGATTGEITVTLLWNSHGDLDLVVSCPTGRRLDYRNPAECGGTLDVDANTARDKLQDRPVENMFWPAGKAAPGSYRVAVRYIPRKDEQAPQETSYQVRLSRGGRESVFKGMIRPGATVPVTGFTVER